MDIGVYISECIYLYTYIHICMHALTPICQPAQVCCIINWVSSAHWFLEELGITFLTRKLHPERRKHKEASPVTIASLSLKWMQTFSGFLFVFCFAPYEYKNSNLVWKSNHFNTCRLYLQTEYETCIKFQYSVSPGDSCLLTPRSLAAWKSIFKNDSKHEG